MLIFLVRIPVSAETKLIARILLSQTQVYLESPAGFTVTEDEIFIISDAKAGNVKLFNNNGQLIKILGRKGPGPDEYKIPAACDYSMPYFALLDNSKMKVFIYRKDEANEFEKIKEIFCPGCISDIVLYKNNIIVDDLIISNEKKYHLYMKDFNDKRIAYLLPVEIRYGLKSIEEYDQKYQDLSKITSQLGFLDTYGDNVYYVWDALLRIVKINLKTKQQKFFGKETKDYTRPKVSREIIKAFNQRDVKKIEEEWDKMSRVVGVFAGEDIMGVLYTNLDKNLSLWKATLHLYNLEGELLREEKLPYAEDYGRFLRNFYDEENDYLYILSRHFNEETSIDEFEILKYKIKE